MAGKGHKVDTAQLNEAAKVLQDLPKQACEGPIGAVEQINLNSGSFGPAHGGCFTGYSASIQRLAKCARSYLTASDEFGRKIAASKDLYQSNEDSNAAEMRKH
ncbi:type VII secretion target [Amycolatopsis sp. NPDC089917]|uniref:type VII secretion target n=1 Tax=Amycolatopsis sp. NPDC089917 TaxID=3155187 RepID=UPI00343F89EE